MKINFTGQYNEIARILRTPEDKGVRSQDKAFENILGRLTNETTKKEVVSYGYRGITEGTIADRSEIMARYRFTPPHIDLPPPLPIQEVQDEGPVVKEMSYGVKEQGNTLLSPRIINAKRIRDDENIGVEEGTSLKSIRGMVQSAARKYGVDPSLGMAVIAAESDFNPNAVSSDGHESKGLFQLLDATGAQLHREANGRAPYNPFHPETNIDLGVSYLRKLHDLFSQPSELGGSISTQAAENSSSLEKLAVAAFNAGEGRVASAQERARREGKNPASYDQISTYLPESTQDYVARVLMKKEQLEQNNVG